MYHKHLIIISILVIIYFTKCKSHLHRFKQAVIIRMREATKSQIDRFLRWEMELANSSDVWFIVNEGKKKYKYNFHNIFYICIEEIFKTYPNIKELQHKGHCANYRKSYNRFYMWISHTESIIMWYNKIGKKYDHVWILEQDLGVTGNIYDILSSYADPYDLITYDIDESRFNNFVYIYCYSNNYLEWRLAFVNRNTSYSTREFIQRWSRKLLNILDEELKRGMHAISEMSIIETVLFKNLSYQLLNKKHIGYKFKWSTRINKREWGRIVNNESLKNKLFHSLKF